MSGLRYSLGWNRDPRKRVRSYFNFERYISTKAWDIGVRRIVRKRKGGEAQNMPASELVVLEARRLWATLSAVAACLDHVVFLGGQAIDNIQ